MTAAVIERFIENLPRRPYATNDFSRGIRLTPRERALGCAYIQPNRPNKLTYLVFDLDKPESAVAWQDADLPPPTLTIKNPENGHAHLAYELASPVWAGGYNKKPIRYCEALEASYSHLLGADKGYVGLITKNPLNSRWQTFTHDAVYNLDYLADFVDLGNLPSKAANDESALGRNCTLFEAIRKVAYRFVHDCQCHDQLFIQVVNAARRYNAESFSVPLSDAEVQCVARSIAKWTWSHRNGIAWRYSQRQSRRAKLSAASKRKATEERIIAAIGTLTAQGKRVTKAAVAREIGISKAALSKYYSHLFIK